MHGIQMAGNLRIGEKKRKMGKRDREKNRKKN